MEDQRKNRKSVLRAWILYYWANSVYPLVIVAAIFPVYYSDVTEKAFGGDVVNFLGIEIVNSVLYTYTVAASLLFVSVLTPLLSGIADYSGLKKQFLVFFTILGASASSALYFFDGHNLLWGMTAIALAAIGFSSSLIFYNAYLPQITTPDRYDALSAKGFAMGYLGSAIMLTICVALIASPSTFGIPGEDFAKRLSFVFTGVWWLGFASISFAFLPGAPTRKKIKPEILTYGFRELKSVIYNMKGLTDLHRFLKSYFLFSAGMQTIMIVAILFANREIDIEEYLLVATILIMQFLAVGGAFLSSLVCKLKGNLFTLVVSLIVWVGVCLGAYFVETATGFMILAGMVGMVLGGTQAISRSTFTKLLPARNDHNSFYSFYEVLEKIAIVTGVFAFGFIESMTGSMRYSVLFITLFFIGSIIFMLRIQNRKL